MLASQHLKSLTAPDGPDRGAYWYALPTICHSGRSIGPPPCRCARTGRWSKRPQPAGGRDCRIMRRGAYMTTQHIQTYCAMCVSRCGVVATVEDGLFRKVTADPAHPNGCICVKGTAAPEIVYAPDRLRYPMKRTRPKGDADPGWCASRDEYGTHGLPASDIKASMGLRRWSWDGTPAAPPPPTTGTATAPANAFGSPTSRTPSISALELVLWLAVYLRRDAAATGLRSGPLHSPLGPQPRGLWRLRRRASARPERRACSSY
jgi:hypothetical protein